MGTYLSTPVLDKDVEEGTDLDSSSTPVSWAVVDMQGWRKTMEDSHLAQTKVSACEEENNPDKVAQVFGVFDGHGGAEVARFCSLYLIDVLKQQPEWANGSDVGQAFVKSFHALDRMIGDEKRRNEISELRTKKPAHGASRTIAATFPIPVVEDILSASTDEGIGRKEKSDEHIKDGLETNALEEKEDVESKVEKNVSNDNCEQKDGNVLKTSTTIDTTTKEEEKKENVQIDDDSVKAILPDELSDDESLNDSDDSDENEQFLDSHNDVTQLLKRFLSIQSSDKGQGQIQLESAADTSDKSNSDNQSQQNAASPVEKTFEKIKPCASIPSRIENGRTVCNLPDHSIHAGCTSVCAAIVNRVLTVANAGDSRAVLCRAGGLTKALSFDHKPLQDVEMKRIKNAGGFVNQFGRVNGNLNLSRAIGDLKYKQVPGIPPSGQMITAEPDIQQ
jgi:serine/threonine protein phosphatase PrpC